MKVYGYTFTDTVLTEAFSSWDPSTGCSGLKERLTKLVDHPSHAISRAADRILQKKRRCGEIAPITGIRSWKKLNV